MARSVYAHLVPQWCLQVACEKDIEKVVFLTALVRIRGQCETRFQTSDNGAVGPMSTLRDSLEYFTGRLAYSPAWLASMFAFGQYVYLGRVKEADLELVEGVCEAPEEAIACIGIGEIKGFREGFVGDVGISQSLASGIDNFVVGVGLGLT